jgi:4'-phosphopantetheinyl transferase
VRASVADAWAPGPLRPSLPDGAVHVWRADLAAASSDLGELLSREEQERAERILDERQGELWRRSRGLLRALLGRYLEQEPSLLRFATGEHGKPELVQVDADAPSAPQTASPGTGIRTGRVAFNMSHSEGLALYAFSHAGAVGVDVEVARRTIDEVAIAKRMLGTAEAQRLEALDPPSRRREFLSAWARNEAELKCLGVGIAGADAQQGRERLWVATLELGPDAGAAVATEQQARELGCWDWRG